jgi:multiple sugar transport system substrate-binding protein
MWESKLYNTPSFFHTRIPSGKRTHPEVTGAKTVRDLFEAWFKDDPFALKGEATDKLKVLLTAENWATNVGHPGPASPAIGEVFSTFVIPNMFAQVARGSKSPEAAVKEAAAQCRQIFEKWRKQGLVGGKG